MKKNASNTKIINRGMWNYNQQPRDAWILGVIVVVMLVVATLVFSFSPTAVARRHARRANIGMVR